MRDWAVAIGVTVVLLLAIKAVASIVKAGHPYQGSPIILFYT